MVDVKYASPEPGVKNLILVKDEKQAKRGITEKDNLTRVFMVDEKARPPATNNRL